MKSLLVLAALASLGVARADSLYFAIATGGAKVGYAVFSETPDAFAGRPAIRTTSHIEVTENLGGTKLKATADDVLWTTPENRPLREVSTSALGEMRSRTEATFGEKTVEVDVESGGKRTHLSVPIPDGTLVGDSNRLLRERLAPGETRTFWSYEIGSPAFTKNELKTVGPASFERAGTKVTAELTELKSDADTMRVFKDAGGIVRIELPASLPLYAEGATLDAEPKAVALARPDPRQEAPDILVANSLHTTRPIEDGEHLTGLRLRVVGEDLSGIPSDGFQTVTQDGDGWIVDVHPPKLADSAPSPLGAGTAGQEAWLKAGEHLSLDDPKLRAAARRAVGKGTDAPAAILAIRRDVARRMKATMEFGDVRDAADILRSPHGKCTEYAVLATALLRAAGIPARIVSGLVTVDGTFFYHSWAEAWDGRRWIGVDAVFEEDQISAGHLKLVEGDATTGFRIAYPADPRAVRIDVLEQRR